MATYESRKYAIPGANITNIAATAIADGSVNDTEFQSVDTTTSISTQLGTKLPKAGGTMTGGIVFPDDTSPAPAKVSFGAGDDLRIFSDGSVGIMKGNDLRFKDSSDNEMLKAVTSGSVKLSHSGSTKLETSATGVSISGTVSATTASATTGSFTNVSGNGSSLTSLNASNLSSGTVPDARLPASALSSDYQKLSTVSLSSNASQLGFLGPQSGFDSSFRHYKVLLHGKWQNMNNNASYLALRVSTNNNNYISSSIYHFTHLFMSTNAGNFTYYGGGQNAHYFSRWNPYGTMGSKTTASEITIFGANETNANKIIETRGGSWDRSQSADVHAQLSGGTIETTSAINGIVLFHADGANISSGAGATLYGIK
jgi:hypothetical protein